MPPLMKFRRDDHFGEDLGNGVRAGTVQGFVDGDDSTEWGLFVGRKCFVPGFTKAFTLSHTAGVCVF